jgi:hypothetical protein
MNVKSIYELGRKRGASGLHARLKHIDDRLVWFGFGLLQDHVTKFGISEVQGKIDLQTYRNLSSTPPPERRPGPAGHGAKAGAFERPEGFVALFDVPRSLDDLIDTKLPDARKENRLALEVLPPPVRAVEPDAVRALLAATELRTSCALVYQSLTSAEPRERVVCPHALVKASGRWHVRAFDFSRKAFIDLSLSRVLSSSPALGRTPVPFDLDDDWHVQVTVEFIPHPELSSSQKTAVLREFGMADGCLKIDVRRALLFYLLDETRLLNAVRQTDETLGRGSALWVRNVGNVTAELARMTFES